MKKTLIVDCDGVLYPMAQIPLAEFVGAMKNTAKELDISAEEYNQASQITMDNKFLGMFNFIKELCHRDNDKFEDYCLRMIEKLDYSKIERDDNLLKLLKQAKNYNDIVILTNNHGTHLDKVLEAKVGYNTQTLGIECYDIRDTEKDGVFYPKQSEQGLLLFVEKLGKNVEDCVLVDDSVRNIKVAEAVGMSGVLINEEYSLSNYLRSTIPDAPLNFKKDKEY